MRTLVTARPLPALAVAAVALAGLALAWAGAAALVARLDPPNSDFFKLWLAARMILEGGDPYRAADWLAGHARYGATWLPEDTSLYPLPLALLLAPLGLLAVAPAFTAWVVISLLLSLAATWLTLTSSPRPRWAPYLLPFLAGLLLYRPLLVTLWSGQMSALLLFALALALWCWERGRWWQGGAALALFALKPSLGGPLIAALALWLLLGRRWAALAGLAGGAVGLLLLGALRSPLWPIDFLAIGGERLGERLGSTPNVWGLAFLALGGAPGDTLRLGLLLAGLLLAACAATLWHRLPALSPRAAVAWAAPLALLITPYTYAYDQLILLVPALALALALAERGAPFLAVALAPLGLSAVALLCSIPADTIGHDILSVGVPLAMLAAAAAPKSDRPASPPAGQGHHAERAI